MMKGTLDLRYYYVEKLLLQGLPVNELTEKERRHELGQSRSIKVIVWEFIIVLFLALFLPI